MLLVVFGHTLTGTTADAYSTTVYNIIWSLQVPLFMLISGYVTKYSKKPESFKEFFESLGKKTSAYLLPFFVWTVIVKGLILGQDSFRDIKYIVWHMDAGHWFLFSLWTITIVYSVASFVSNKLKCESKILVCAVTGIGYVAGMAVLATLGLFLGMNFLCIKLILYYMPFYFAGYLFSMLCDRMLCSSVGRKIARIAIALCLGVYVVIVTRVNLFDISEGATGIIIRAAASLTGCVALCYILPSMIKSEGRIYKFLSWFGVHSLEIYLVHYVFLSLVKTDALPSLMSPRGVLLCGGNFVLAVALSVFTVKALSVGDVLPAVLFGKFKRKNK